MTTLDTEIIYVRDSRDYDCYITIDGQREYIGSAPTYIAGDAKCREYALSYYEDNHTPEKVAELVMADPPAEPTDDGQPVGPDAPAAERGHADSIRTSGLWLLSRGIDACTICGDAHRPTQCPEVAQARLGLPTPPDAGAAIARQFHRDRARFLAVLGNLDRDAWRVLAEAYCAYMSRFGTWSTPTHVLAVWAKAVDAGIVLPSSAA